VVKGSDIIREAITILRSLRDDFDYIEFATHLNSKGILDLEDGEEFENTIEAFEQLIQNKFEAKTELKVKEVLNNLNAESEGLYEHLKNGGKVQDFITVPSPVITLGNLLKVFTTASFMLLHSTLSVQNTLTWYQSVRSPNCVVLNVIGWYNMYDLLTSPCLPRA
jgi:transcriptional antiterminator Rof (Rho-off)